VNTLVIDASIAVKWVVEESGTPEALTLRRRARLVAPDLLAVECANVLWKKVQRHELSREEPLLARRLLQGAEIELVPTRSLLEAGARIAIELDHPAYDCLYLALAIVTATSPNRISFTAALSRRSAPMMDVRARRQHPAATTTR
jgi:predicted nucleic acid-binding protein